jgi:hypothetical protein
MDVQKGVVPFARRPAVSKDRLPECSFRNIHTFKEKGGFKRRLVSFSIIAPFISTLPR